MLKIPVTEITDTEQRTEENKWKIKKEKRETFENLTMDLTKMFKESINPALHFGIRGMDTEGFVTMPPVEILANLKRLHGKPIYQEIDAALIYLNQPMNQMQTIEVMIRVIEDLQLFLLANPGKDRAFTKTNLISNALIKLTKTRECMQKV